MFIFEYQRKQDDNNFQKSHSFISFFSHHTVNLQNVKRQVLVIHEISPPGVGIVILVILVVCFVTMVTRVAFFMIFKNI